LKAILNIPMDNTSIEGTEKLEESLVRRNAKVCINKRAKALKPHVSNHSEIEV
jgi:hypothetical protein